MSINIKRPEAFLLLAALTIPTTGTAIAQPGYEQELTGSVTDDTQPTQAEMTVGPEITGIISARSGDKMRVTSADGSKTVIAINDDTQITSTGGFLGLNRTKLAASSLYNGIPVTVKTMQWGGSLIASKINLTNRDLRTAAMIHNGTAQGFEEQTAATAALRGRMGEIDQYNIKSTTNVTFDTGKSNLSPQAKAELCAAAAAAEQTKNALMLVVGYTDSRGSDDYNQRLSEARAGRVINYLQQQCGWKPYRMLTPTGMSEYDPIASNDTPDGMAQNRRVAVNILVSKAVDGL